MKEKKRITIILLLALALSSIAGSILFTQAYTGQVLTEFMSSPLPSVPEPVLQGGDFPVTVKDLSPDLAGGAASAWSGVVTSIYGSYDLALVNGTFDGEKWMLYFSIPAETHVGLYNLTLMQGSLNVHQSRCVWVLEDYPESITFSQVTDIHEPIGEVQFPQYIMQTNFLNPDFMITTGDNVQTETNARAWAFLQYAMLQLEYPSYLVPGNHDYSGNGGKGYARYGGKLNYTLVLGDFVFIAADSDGIGYLSSSQLAWIESTLSKYPDKVKILAFHHPLISSEYEDDLGATTGASLEADWQNIDALSDIMYFTWMDDGVPLPEAQEFLRIVQQYDVRLVLNGHVHRDLIYIVNNQHYFVTTSTNGGGLPPDSRYGSRLITIDGDSTVHLDQYALENIDNPPNNLPTGYVTYTYRSANDFTGTAVTAVVKNELEMPITEGRLIFKVSKSKPLDSYVFVGDQPARVEKTATNEGYVFDAYFDMEARSSMETTLKAADDNTDPEIWASLAQLYTVGSPTTVTLSASDLGWGLKELSASFSLDGNSWIPLESDIQPVFSGEVYKDTFPEMDVTFDVAALTDGESIYVRAEAIDYAGNTASFQSENLAAAAPTMYTLSVDSSPVKVDLEVDGDAVSTPYEASLESGDYTIGAPATVVDGGDTYEFQRWSTGSTSMEITVTLSGDTSISASYLKQESSEPAPEPETPSGGIPLPVSFIGIGVLVAALIISRKQRIPN